MGVDAHYFSPTTPGAASFDVDVSDAIRRGRIGPLSKEAQVGAVGSGVVVLDDLDGTLGYLGDGILGLKQFYMNETECPAGNQRFFTGYTFDRAYYRGDSLVQGPARKVDVTLADTNAFLSFRVFAPVALDPTSSFDRPAETHIQRIQALLAVDFLSTTLFDLGYIPTTGGVQMSAKSYEGSRPVDVLNDCAQVSGWNGWVGYDETENKLFLWFDDWRTDGTDTIPYDSSLRLTNVESEKDNVTTFLFEKNARENRNPNRVVSAAYGMGEGVTGYRTLPSTANIFGWRDMIAPSFFVKDQTKLNALLDRYLLDNSTEEIRIPLTVQVPVNLVTAIKEGQRIQVHGTHFKSVSADFTWCRILHLSVRRDLDTMEFYWLDLEVSPIVTPPTPGLPLWANLQWLTQFGLGSSVTDSSPGFIDPVGEATAIPGDGLAALFLMLWTGQGVAGTGQLVSLPAVLVEEGTNTWVPFPGGYKAGIAEMIIDPTSGDYSMGGTTGQLGTDTVSTLVSFTKPTGSPYTRVQSQIANGTVTLSSPATVGNLLVLGIVVGATHSYFPGYVDTDSPDIPDQTGWTAAAPTAKMTSPHLDLDEWPAVRMFYKIAEGGETAIPIDPGPWPFSTGIVVEYAP